MMRYIANDVFQLDYRTTLPMATHLGNPQPDSGSTLKMEMTLALSLFTTHVSPVLWLMARNVSMLSIPPP